MACRNVSMLKLRTGYGRSGNLGGISSYTTMNLVRQNGIVSVNSSPTVTMGMIRNNNPDLKWETRSTWNIGGDLGLWNNRLVLTAEYYYSKTTDMLYAYDVPVPPFAYDKLLANIGSMSNQGLEIGFSVTPIAKKDMELNINMNLAWQKNKLLSLSGEYDGMQMSAAKVTAMGSLSGAGSMVVTTISSIRSWGSLWVCSICLIARVSCRMAMGIIAMTSRTWTKMERSI